ncbi:MAG: DUF3048 domain-containing protein [Candidatus Kerfeldbacteria bacterium]
MSGKKKTEKSTGLHSQDFMKKYHSPLSKISAFLGLGLISFGGYTLVAVAVTNQSFFDARELLKSAIYDMPTVIQRVKEEIVQDELPRRIDGVVVPAELSNPVLSCVMIENAAFGGVRPQSGLQAASVVYEVIVEGGITRFMAVYADGANVAVGPVRSARDTYLEFVSELECAYSHAGGSYTAMLALQRFGLRDIDALRESTYFWRDSSKEAPHNLFTSTEDLTRANVDHRWANEEQPQYYPWKFQDPLDEIDAQAGGKAMTGISIAFGGSYNVEYRYDREANSYLRSNAGVAHTDANTGGPIHVSNIVIQHVGEGISIEGKGRINWPVTGEGIVEIFHDGRLYTGTWKKETRQDRTRFFDHNGREIPLLRGNIWIAFVPDYIPVEIE